MSNGKEHIKITEKEIYYERIKKVVAYATYLQDEKWPVNAADLFVEDLRREGFEINDDKSKRIKAVMANKIHLDQLLSEIEAILSKKE